MNNNNSLYTLEFNKIKEILSSFALTFLGKKEVFNLLPSNNLDDISLMQAQTSEATLLTIKKGNIPMVPIADIRISLKKLEANSVLSAKELLDIAKILNLSKNLKNYFFNEYLDVDVSFAKNIESYFSNLYLNNKIEDDIFEAILDENTISDRATPELYSIRRKQKDLEGKIRDKLTQIVTSSKYSKILQDSIITIRNGRFVIPVKQESRSEISGFIHDISSSGSTVFIEPTAVFDMNNSIKELKLEEELEIERILSTLSSEVFEITDELYSNLSLIKTIDFIFAKAKYSIHLNAIPPILNENNEINLIKARHPLIDQNKVVPIDINIGENYSSLVITGPNTGGKTVTLKTVGLLTLMALSGLHIPAKENSTIGVFDNIFVDIGDSQSIEQSLSTFSSHMLNIIDILKNVTYKSLVLLDELGSGTDPMEGSSLAIAILEHLNNLGCTTLATTHYEELKNFVSSTEGFENASCEFDLDTLLPTYKILIGVAGSSNAFAISQKLGLSTEIIKNAKSKISTNITSEEEILTRLKKDKISIEKEIALYTTQLSVFKSENEILENKIKTLKEKEESMLTNAKIEARQVLINAKNEADEIIKELHSYKNSTFSASSAEKNRSKLKSKISKLSNDLVKSDNSTPTSININTLKVGQEVFIKSLGKNAIIQSISSKDNKIIVQAGVMKFPVKLSDIDTSKLKSTSKSSYSNIKSTTISPEINLLGYTVDEAVSVLDKYLDDASISKLNTIRIVHGKGTGALRQGVHTFLKKHPHVKSFRLGTFGEGEMGVTIVELK